MQAERLISAPPVAENARFMNPSQPTAGHCQPVENVVEHRIAHNWGRVDAASRLIFGMPEISLRLCF
jgi:hypothetical protein